MKKTKKMMALALAASMVMSSSITAFADDPTTGTGTTSGTGTTEGHVNKEKLNVLLPTVDAGNSAFSYTMDPERLIQGTDAAKYAEGTIFPEAANDTGVYFLTAENTYANTSNIYQIVNKSSCNIKLSVKVKTTENTSNDIPLATTEDLSSETNAKLYLGLKVGTNTTVVKSDEQEITKVISGTPTNFKVAVKTTGEGDSITKEYEYQEKDDATAWKALNISLTGKVNQKDIAANTTAPTVNVTWKWEKAGDSDTVDTADQVDFTTAPAQSSAGAITVPATGNATAVVTIGLDEAIPTSLTTTALSGNLLTTAGGYGVNYNSETKTITFGSDLSGYMTDKSMVFVLTFETEDGTTYTQTMSYN